MRRCSGVVCLVVALTLVFGGCGQDSSPGAALPNVRLGMSPRDVRSRFQPGGEGSWQTALGTGDDTMLEWASRDPKATVTQARFEFHLGMLVAIRARTVESSAKETVALTPRTVTVHAPAREGGTSVTVLARDCPTHKDEAESLAMKTH